MSEELSNYIQDSNCLDKVPNTKLIYEYTESAIKMQRESLDKLNTKLSGFLAFTGVLIKFCGDLPGKVNIYGLTCYSCLILTISAYICLSIAVLFLCLGLSVEPSFKVIPPEKLMEDKWYFANNGEISDFIISARIKVVLDYEKRAYSKGQKLNVAIWLIAASLGITVISAVIKTIWG
jgi:hypothetical protein